MAVQSSGDKTTLQIAIESNMEAFKAIQNGFQGVASSANKLSANLRKVGKIGTASLATIGKSALKLTASIAGAGYALNSLLGSSLQTSSRLQSFTNSTGLATDAVQQLAKAGAVVNQNLTFDNVVGSIENLQKKLVDVKLGRGSAMEFFQVGINPYMEKDAMSIIDTLQDKLKQIPEQLQGKALAQLGLGPDMLDVIKLTKGQRSGLGGQIMDNKQLNSINRAGIAMRQLKQTFSDFRNQAVATIAPDLMKMFTTISSAIRRNSAKITATIKTVVQWLGKFGQSMFNAISVAGKLVVSVGKATGAFDNLKAVAVALGIAFAPAKMAFLFILGVIEDIYYWQKGEANVFGNIYNGIEKIADVFKPMWDALGPLQGLIKNLGIAFLAWEAIRWSGIAGGITSVAGALKGFGRVLKANPWIFTAIGAFELWQNREAIGEGVKGLGEKFSQSKTGENLKIWNDKFTGWLEEKTGWDMSNMYSKQPTDKNAVAGAMGGNVVNQDNRNIVVNVGSTREANEVVSNAKNTPEFIVQNATKPKKR